MNFPRHFISAGYDYTTRDKNVPAPLFRKTFTIDNNFDKAELLICGLGFYELFLNGEKITKGALAPYISAPKDLVYYDKYDLKDKLLKGKNVLGVILGNGFQNNPGGYIWDFDKAVWCGAPRLALSLEIEKDSKKSVIFESDETFKTTNSPIVFDDYRVGEIYNANLEIENWNMVDFDDTDWKNAVHIDSPSGEKILCEVEPIIITKELEPLKITKCNDGYIYDFGENWAGVCKLKISGTQGQQITLYHGEHLIGGELDRENLTCDRTTEHQKDIYICSGKGIETYTPMFTYHGFQYVYVQGITQEQATKDLLTYLVMNSDLDERGNFSCSNEIINKLQDMTLRSTLSNFYYFPTDCPQREKNGWTADAALSAEHTLINFSCEKSFGEWLRNIRKSQADDGQLPGIVPTGGWGFKWGNGPAWDSVLIYLPYFTYIYRHDKNILKENAHAILRYLEYLTTLIESDGLVYKGLGDWCNVNRESNDYKAPDVFTNTVISMDIAKKAEFIFSVLDMKLSRDFATNLYNDLRKSARKKLLDKNTLIAFGNCQTSQAMAIFYELFENAEKDKAFKVLLEMLENNNFKLDVGVLGGRVIFHVLSNFGYSDIAYKMISSTEFPSYGYWAEQNYSTLLENFRLTGDFVKSLNHHFWGDISHWFTRHLAGINYNPNCAIDETECEINIKPAFIDELDFAEGFHIAPEGKIYSKWERKENDITLTLEIPSNLKGYIILPKDYSFADERKIKAVDSGTFSIIKI